jgi:glycogen phosphorylase
MVKPVATVNVTPKLPPELARLHDLAYNMRFAWDTETITLFRRLSPELWEQTNHNPVWMLGAVSQEKLNAAANDPAFITHLERASRGLDDYMANKSTWFDTSYTHLSKTPVIAYFSMEFGVSESFQNYSGGLGVLSGDHLKSASDLNLPLVAVGLLYQEGYFQQYLNADGWQQESYPINDFNKLPLEKILDDNGNPIRVDVPLPGRQLYAHVWKAQVGRTPLYLLDSNIPDNPRDEDRSLTDRLYGGDKRTRIRQEILLGIGGIRMLEALGLRPDVCHMNEGHSAFLLLERIRILMRETPDVNFYQAGEIIAASTVFTIHTPVPAGLERFGFDLIDEHFTDYMRELGLDREAFIDLGRENMGSYDLFSMSVMALRFSYGANGVAQLHGEVSRNMWNWLYPNLPTHEVPIEAITNGIHVESWVSSEMAQLFDRYLDPAWRTDPSNAAVWDKIDDVPDGELWRSHERRRERLVAFCRTRLKQQLLRRGASQSEIAAADEVLDPDALTIGFARRFATYKRGALIFHDLERLDSILNNAQRPVQLIFAGKAHPHDNGGKEIIRDIVRVGDNTRFRHTVIFLENYDMNVTRYMLQGSDIWLNNPRRPREASGTSGMKAIYNACLNFSILDGWWDEGYAPHMGWSIGNGEEYPEDMAEEQDRIEVEAIYNTLETDIVPMFYQRGRDGLPREWISKVKAAIKGMAAFFNTHRMVKQYTTQYYIPNFERQQKMLQPDVKSAVDYANWRYHLNNVWSQLRVDQVQLTDSQAQIGGQGEVIAKAHLGPLSPDDVRVQLYYGKLDTRGNIVDGKAVNMEVIEGTGNGDYTFRAVHHYDEAGDLGLSVRIVPYHEYMHTSFQPGLITWA